jgi:hypothetical protein
VPGGKSLSVSVLGIVHKDAGSCPGVLYRQTGDVRVFEASPENVETQAPEVCINIAWDLVRPVFEMSPQSLGGVLPVTFVVGAGGRESKRIVEDSSEALSRPSATISSDKHVLLQQISRERVTDRLYWIGILTFGPAIYAAVN